LGKTDLSHSHEHRKRFDPIAHKSMSISARRRFQQTRSLISGVGAAALSR
jgi:hypothetical protein